MLRPPDNDESPQEGLSRGLSDKSPARAIVAAQSTAPKWAGVSHELDILTTEALAIDWWGLRVEPKLALDLETRHLGWTGLRNRDGYGRVALPTAVAPRGGRTVYVHRAALIRHLGGPLPYGWTVDHVCGDKSCANAAEGHIEAVPMRVNIARASGVSQAGVASRLATGLCPQGHPGPWRRNHRRPDSWMCAECNRLSSARSDAAMSAAHKGLGLTQAAYRALFGQSITTAHNVLAAIDLGRDPQSIVAGARIALEAAEREGVLSWLASLANEGNHPEFITPAADLRADDEEDDHDA